jgi:hypothetical protein
MRKLLVGSAVVYSLFLITLPLRAQIQGGWANTGNLNASRENATQVTLADGKVLVAGGGRTAATLLPVPNSMTLQRAFGLLPATWLQRGRGLRQWC